MKNFKFILLAGAIAFFFTTAMQAQTYGSALGARLGYPLSISYKKFIDQSAALEGYMGFRRWSNRRWVSINLAYQAHFPLEGVTNLQWYVGGGGGLYFWNYDIGFNENGSEVGIGIQGYLGLDYKFEDVPLNITLDWVPTLFLTGFRTGFGASYANIGVRYVLD